MTKDTEKANEAETKKPVSVVQQLMQDVSENPMQIKWPRDKWGITTGLKKEVIAAGGSVRDNQDKYDTLLNTLAVAIAHVQKRRAKDVRVLQMSRDSHKVAKDDRLPRQRVSAGLVAPTTDLKSID